MFDPTAETCLQTDASRKHGLGFALLQKDKDDKWRLIQCGSRFLKDVETSYAMVELEALAIYWAIKKTETYLAGLPFFTVVTDHSPLISLFNKFTIDCIDNPRVQNYRTKLMHFNFHTVWKKGKDHCIPDALSGLQSVKLMRTKKKSPAFQPMPLFCHRSNKKQKTFSSTIFGNKRSMTPTTNNSSSQSPMASNKPTNRLQPSSGSCNLNSGSTTD
ncbi:Uncharacterized protein FKW44_013925 [Caligus rogercresseyi]|uniref:Reverse transcriptase RNase H-like domain-containing protein n=1 Tax=Caligus rogercresseyi TaxID=217165 RepID=A0A7T8GY68_CALRO|nr:Uncharacterized protein FKW44_013925 [Caligus rogercresseyi]